MLCSKEHTIHSKLCNPLHLFMRNYWQFKSSVWKSNTVTGKKNKRPLKFSLSLNLLDFHILFNHISSQFQMEILPFRIDLDSPQKIKISNGFITCYWTLHVSTLLYIVWSKNNCKNNTFFLFIVFLIWKKKCSKRQHFYFQFRRNGKKISQVSF